MPSARQYAERMRPATGSAEYFSLIDEVKQKFINENGARFKDSSKLYHIDLGYNLRDLLGIDLQVGGNLRLFDIFSHGTIFNEDSRRWSKLSALIQRMEGGFYTQLRHSLLQDRLYVVGSLRIDKKQDFEGVLTPRLAMSFALSKSHFLRASIQTAFRNPDSQSQFIYFLTGEGIVLGGAPSNAKRYNIHNGGAYTSTVLCRLYCLWGRVIRRWRTHRG